MSMFETEPNYCPHCMAKMDLACSFDDTTVGAPTPGDLVVCVECDTVMYFEKDLRVREATEEEMEALDPEFKFSICCAKLVNKEFRRKAEKQKGG